MPHDPVDLADLITKTEAGRLRGITRQAVHSHVLRGRLKTFAVGGKTFVSRREVRSLKLERIKRSGTDMIRDVRDVARSLGRMPTSSEYRDRGSVPLSSVCQRFGGWSEVIKAAGKRKDDHA